MSFLDELAESLVAAHTPAWAVQIAQSMLSQVPDTKVVGTFTSDRLIVIVHAKRFGHMRPQFKVESALWDPEGPEPLSEYQNRVGSHIAAACAGWLAKEEMR